MAQIALIAPATVIAVTGRGKQLPVARDKVSLPSLLPSWRIERVPLPWFASSNSCGDRSAVVKVSEGGAISLTHCPAEKLKTWIALVAILCFLCFILKETVTGGKGSKGCGRRYESAASSSSWDNYGRYPPQSPQFCHLN